MSRRLAGCTLVLLLAAFTQPLASQDDRSAPERRSAQDAAYSRTPGDTLRYHEVSTATVELVTPQGTVPIRSRHDARMAVTFTAGDTARAWYEALAISATTPQGELAPATESVLGDVFVLRFDGRGRIETLSTPEFPAEFENVTDLRYQFADYFLPLPDRPLALGTEWQDSIVRADSAAPDLSTVAKRWSTYRVAGDTLIDGVRALVIESRSRHRIDGVRPLQGMQVTSSLAGEEAGQFYWDDAARRLLGRSRGGEMRGSMRMAGNAGEVTYEQRYVYENSLELLR